MDDNFDVSGFVSDIIKSALKKDNKREYMKEYWNKNKEELKVINNERRKTYNKGKKALKQDREKRREYEQKYRNSPVGKKRKTINQWKSRGLNMDSFEEVYDKYLQATHCELCKIEFGKTNNGKQKCMDHCHVSGIFRNIVCRNCNMNIIR